MTVRSLESLIRLSEAIAKLKFSAQVTVKHVDEAIKLMQSSLLKLERETISLDNSDGLPQQEDDGDQGNGKRSEWICVLGDWKC